MLLRRRKLLWSLVKMLWSSRRTQPPVDCLWSLVPSFPGLSVNSDNLPFSYVILFLLFTFVSYMHETWSWHAYRFALGFLWKNRCDTQQQNQNPGAAKGNHGKNLIFQVKQGQLNFMGNNSIREPLPTATFTFESRDEILFKGCKL
jgi:hypothetical protein